MRSLTPAPHAVLHPATFLLLWVLLAFLAQLLRDSALGAMALLSIVLALSVSGQRFVYLLRRTRWIFLSILLLYGYITSGEHLFSALGMFSPVREGLEEGGLQLARLLLMLATLSILLSRLSRAELIAALYALLFPVRYLGGDRERIAVRLALTLHYAEQQLHGVALDRQSILRVLDESQAEGGEVELYDQAWSWWDVLAIAGAVVLLAGSLR